MTEEQDLTRRIVLDQSGNAYLYGSWQNGATLEVTQRKYGKEYPLYESAEMAPMAGSNYEVSATNPLPIEDLGTGRITVWTKGVSYTSNWHVVPQGRSNLCWAAAASVTLDWWQKHKPESLTPTKANEPTGLDGWNIFWNYQNTFKNQGSYPAEAFRWWLSGDWNSSLPGLLDPNVNNGGFYADYENINELVWDYLESKGKYYDDGVHEMSEELIRRLKNDCGVILSTPTHAITVWGAEYDASTRLITKLWVTDSASAFAENGKLGYLSVDKIYLPDVGAEILHFTGHLENGSTVGFSQGYMKNLTSISTNY